MARQSYEAIEIDIMKLYTHWDNKRWNDFLQDCYEKNQIERLAQTRAGLMKGFDTVVGKRMQTDNLIITYLRWVKSTEITAKKIIKKLNPLPGDSVAKKEFTGPKWADAKKKRDEEFEKFLRRSAY